MDFFAGANTREGFFSLFDECFSSVRQKYLLKGSSGCGKSTLMKRIAEKAEALSMEVSRIYCSADADSLDGIIIRELGVAVIDATAPHLMDVKYPCVRESIINLGEFWDRSAVLTHESEIIGLTDRKSALYREAYGRLAVAGTVADLYRGCVSRVTDRKALEKAAFTLFNRVAAGARGGRITRVFTSAFSADGIKTLPTFGSVLTVYKVSGRAKEALLSTFIGILRERGVEAVISLSPTDARYADAVFIPSSGAVVSLSEAVPVRSCESVRGVSTARLLTPAADSVRLRLRTLERLEKDILREATEILSEAREAHRQIEQIYIPTMDFAALDERTGRLAKEIFET